MCPSMADRDDSYTPKPKKLSLEVSANQANQESSSKYYNQFLYKAIIVALFLVIVPLLPSQAPEFVNQNLQYSRSWELLQLIFVGIAVSYGLFSKRNDETDKDHHNQQQQHNSPAATNKFDNAQSYVAGLLQVSSVFDDETEPTSVSDDTNSNKIQTWNSQYQRKEPMVVVAEKSPVLEKQRGTASRFDEKPLLLPVRSLKSRVSEPDEKQMTRENSFNNASITRASSNSVSKRFSSSNSGKARNGEFAGLSLVDADDNNMEANVVLRSPIPWRSRSGRMEMKEGDQEGINSYSLPPSAEDSEHKKFESPRSFRSQSSRSLRTHESVSSPSPNKSSTPPQTPSSSSKNLSPSHSFSSEYQAKSAEDFARKKSYVKTTPPPAPPPPPPPFYRKSPLEKSNSALMNRQDFPQKELRRSVRSVPDEFVKTELESLTRRTNSGPELRPKAQTDVSSFGKSVRTIRSAESITREIKPKEFDADVMGEVAKEIEAKSQAKRELTNKLMREAEPKFRRMTSNELQMAEKEDSIEKVLVETDESSEEEAESEDDYVEESVGSSGNAEEVPASNVDNANAAADEGPDVDKKADEFIAKFREQIRLQRIESIRRSTEQIARKQSSR
ncbi:OLC1v1031704C2 [Oldenlandia corymbosa var. corymbosa]|nr:OLC1v1031704C2 [Oldenlandia corymbosa var. corymbosa]